MSNSSNHKCFMCGAPATDRCSKCATAGFDQFYCSPEHQRLLWPVHKRVCGAKSNPFLWPLLDDSECEDLLEAKDKVTHRSTEGYDKDRNLTLVTRWKRDYGYSREKTVEVVKSFRKSYKGPPLVEQPAQKQEMLFLVRALLYLQWGMKSRDASPLGFLDMLAGKSPVPDCDVFSQLASYAQMYLPYPKYCHQNASWWTPLMHRWVAVAYLSMQLPSIPTKQVSEETKEIFNCGKWIAEDGVRSIKQEIESTNPVAAKGPLKEFNQWSREYARAPWQ
ncbi:hypothetical protein JCM3765_004754 [Sporobolomyces pararoseus]